MDLAGADGDDDDDQRREGGRSFSLQQYVAVEA